MKTDIRKPELMPSSSEVDFLHRVGEHLAKGETFHETLATTVDFAVWLVGCDECIAYVRKGGELVARVLKSSRDRSIDQSPLAISSGHAAALARYRQPIAISRDAGEPSKIKHFSTWSTNPGETFVSIPLLARSRMLGAIHLKHQQPHPYSRREFKLLASLGHLLGTNILISELENENSDLLCQLETRKVVERGKGILQRELGLTEEEAYLTLQRQSRQTRRPMKEIAQAIILSDGVRSDSLQAE
jgi:GAF domain-containing protein